MIEAFPVPKITPQRLLRIPAPFDRDDFIFEVKFDGFRALAHIGHGRCALLSRNGNVFKSWPQLGEEIASSVRCDSAILDGEIVCLDAAGKPDFRSLLFRRTAPCFYAFDVLEVEGESLCDLPLWQRKRRLRRIIPRTESRLLEVEPIAARGVDLFHAACDHDLEGIVAKWRHGRYATDGTSTSWMKIKNPGYSQVEGRHELFAASKQARRRKTGAPVLQLA